MKTWTVYMHTSPSGKVYIGITSKKPSYRWGAEGANYARCPYFHNAILKYGWDNITHDIVYQGLTKEEAITVEQALINKYKELNLSYNITDGGEGLIGCTRILSNEWKDKLSKAHLGKHHTSETKAKMSVSRKGKPQTKEWIAKRVIKKQKPVEAFVGGTWIKFNSVKEAAEHFKQCDRNIAAVCRGERHTVNKIKFRYYDSNRV